MRSSSMRQSGPAPRPVARVQLMIGKVRGGEEGLDDWM